MSDHRWLLFGYHLPTRAATVRVRMWRRLQQIGAIAAPSGLQVLPNLAASREDFEWLRGEIIAHGGEATIFVADAVDEAEGDELVLRFQRVRQRDYRALKREADRRLAAARPRRRRNPAPAVNARTLRALRDRLEAIDRRDFFRAPGRDEARAALRELDRVHHGGGAVDRPAVAAGRIDLAAFRKRRWVTRPRPGVDRMASAWLIRRHIDPEGTFAFTERPEAAEVPFDMYEGEFSHQGGACTFEILADHFGFAGEAVTRLGRIVHDLDLKDGRFDPLEAAAVGRIVEGLRDRHADDTALLEAGIMVFDALARSFESGDAGPDTTHFPRRAGRTSGSRSRR